LEIIILTAGFEVLSLDRKDAPQTLPDLTAPHMAHLARRLDGTRALGMYRISENEFLLCYDGTHPFSH
jgi:CNH domain